MGEVAVGDAEGARLVECVECAQPVQDDLETEFVAVESEIARAAGEKPAKCPVCYLMSHRITTPTPPWHVIYHCQLVHQRCTTVLQDVYGRIRSTAPKQTPCLLQRHAGQQLPESSARPPAEVLIAHEGRCLHQRYNWPLLVDLTG